MSGDKYYVIGNSDGDTYVDECNKEVLEERINEKYYGNVNFIDNIVTNDTNYWKNEVLIIKGKIVVPKDEKVVIKRVIE